MQQEVFMKQYKVERVKLSLSDIGSSNFEKLEAVMNDKAKEGWDVVCISPQPGTNTTFVLVTFCRDDN